MRKYRWAVLSCIAILAVGCSSGKSNTTISQIGIGTTAAETAETAAKAEASGEGLIDQENNREIESLEAKVESLEALVESYKAREESLKAAEESAGGRGESDGQTTRPAAPDYDTLVRFAPDYVGTNVTYTGTVIQSVALGSNSMQLLMAEGGNNAKRLVGEFSRGLIPYDLGNGDTVTVTGTFQGVMRYMMGSGERVELPSMAIVSMTRDRAAEMTAAPTAAETSAASESVPQGPGSGSAGPGNTTPVGPGYSGSSSGPGSTGSAEGASGSGAGTGPGGAVTETTGSQEQGPGSTGSSEAGPGAAGPGSAGPGDSAGPASGPGAGPGN